jgi:Zn-dependent protease
MSLAGPAMNLSIAIIAALFIRIGFMAGVFASPESINFSRVTDAALPGSWELVATMLSILFSLNLILAVFNMLPLPGLDGSSLFLFFVKGRQADQVFSFIHGRGLIFLSIFIAWKFFMYIFNPIHMMAINLLYPGVSYH